MSWSWSVAATLLRLRPSSLYLVPVERRFDAIVLRCQLQSTGSGSCSVTSTVDDVAVRDVWRLLQANPKAQLIDVRT